MKETVRDRRLLLVVFLALLNDRLARCLIIPLLPYLLLQFHTSGLVMGLLLSSYTLTSLVITPFAGHLSDMVGRRPVMLSSLGLGVVGMSVFGFAPNLPLMFTGRMIDGLGGGTASTAASVIADITPSEQQTQSFGLIAMASAIAIVIGPGLGGVLAGLGLRVPILFATLTLLLNLLFAWFDLRETNPALPGGVARLPLSRQGLVAGLRTALRPFQQGGLAGSSLAFGLLSLAGYGLLGIISFYMAKVLGWSPHQTGFAFTIAGAVTVVQQLGVIGRLSRRLGDRATLVLSHGVAALGCLLLLLASPGRAAVPVTAGVTLICLSLGMAAPSIRSIVVGVSDPKATGSGMGMVQSIQNLGSCLGPPLVGLIYDRLNPGASFLATILVLGASLLVLLLVRGSEELRRPLPR
ncbi:MFS transporter [Cyanobium sp. Morenito 9A2]|uniref:MFS transporter n=1 Tax=Cyanobium sp. Morenito 9A2 TaxID=2823718 RepID=UPI0020CF0754|nr:MFS transporter [Cyanobium sp. Morenito 9A2]MCP9849388.1 MFS transporter [Cyanobium sp. Morenito 9A2]